MHRTRRPHFHPHKLDSLLWQLFWSNSEHERLSYIQNPSQLCVQCACHKNSCQCSVELGQSVFNAWPSTKLPLLPLPGYRGMLVCGKGHYIERSQAASVQCSQLDCTSFSLLPLAVTDHVRSLYSGRESSRPSRMLPYLLK